MSVCLEKLLAEEKETGKEKRKKRGREGERDGEG